MYKYAASATKAITENKILFNYASTSSSSSSSSSTTTAKTSNDNDLVYSHSAPFPRPAEMIIRPASLLHLPYIQRQRYYWPVVGGDGGGRPGEGLLGQVPVGLRGLREFDVMAPEVKFREREIASRLYDEKVKKRGWERLGELWEMGRRRREREMKKVDRRHKDEMAGVRDVRAVELGFGS